MDMPLMKCGHTAMSIHNNVHDGLGKDHPSCVICDCCEIVQKPDLTGRIARCAYYASSKPRRRYANDECNYGCQGNSICQCGSIPSSYDLAFFEYKGPDSYASHNMCKLCQYALRAHWPKWEYKFLMVRDWFKNKNINDEETSTEHLPNKKAIERYLEERIKYLLEDSKIPWRYGEYDGQVVTKIHKIEIDYIKGPLPSGRGHDFIPHGPYEYDEFYCGCRGWD